MESSPKRVVIIGGGITGLAAAYAIQEEARASGQPVSFILVEAESRLGGKIISDRMDGFTVEGGPDCFIRQKPWASELAIKLGLEDELIGTNDHQRKVYVLSGGKLKTLPDGVMLIVPTRIMPFATSSLISWPGKLRMGLDLIIPRRGGDDDESVGDFVRRRLGNEALEKIAEPLMSGIHVSDPEQQSLLATFPRFRNIEVNHGSLIKGMLAERKRAGVKNGKAHPAAPSKIPATLFVTLKSGLEKLVDAIAEHLDDGEIIVGQAAAALSRENDGYLLRLENGREIEADAVIMATPAYASAGLLRGIDPQVAEMLDAIRYVSTATVSLAFRKQDIKKPFMGHGLVIPKTEQRKISACTWTSFKFNHRAPDDHLMLRCFVGGPWHEDQVDLSDEEILALVRSELKDLLEIDAEPVLSRIYRWHKSNPQYDVGHLERVKEAKAALRSQDSGLFITGSAYEGVGVPDCVHQGQQTARQVMEFLARLEKQPLPQTF